MKSVSELQAYLDEHVNVLLSAHRGRVEVVDVVGSTVKVKMIGGCRGCAGAKFTLSMIVNNHISTFDPSFTQVVDVTDHSDDTDAYYKGDNGDDT